MIESAGGAMPANLLFAHVDVDSLRIDFHSGIANRGKNASPVGICPGPCRLYQWGVRYRTAYLSRLTSRACFFNVTSQKNAVMPSR